jgi:uncharacterized membrane protein YphA (DoxX/SURF4 family)
MILGLFLFIKGFQFVGDMHGLYELIDPIKSLAGSMAAIHYIAPAHLIGGLLIFAGLLTRWAAIAQLPILIGAVIINFVGIMHTTNLILSLFALALCLFFIIYGSGKRSADYYFKMQQ